MAPFSEADIPDLTGRIAIVTGGNSGIGKQTVKVLLSKGAKVYLAARSEEKARQAIDEIHAADPSTKKGTVEFLKLDLSEAKKAKAAAEDFNRRESSLHLLYNNGGIMGVPAGSKSADGYELQWATNVFGPFVFTYHLLPVLLETAKTSPPGTVRIINTCSSGAGQAPKTGIPLDDPTVGAGASHSACYGHSKLGDLLWTRELAKRYTDQGVWSFGPHPGPVQSNLTHHLGIPKPVMWILNRTVFKPVEYGALTQLFAGTSPTLTAAQSGSYLVPLAKIEPKLPHALAGDDALAKKVWDWNIEAMKKAGAD
ncbi:NAD(P)-binding protein [Punctularia strigosozonata HHB-11173 SS5]|uniref:NAD(P)-binding protein n=1 Tax=Punctularia strigosozonata (strain HHB-11173) TaxID=741275 RepID=UPI0004416C37|nr:NAD(P)-binding protein [Punctularia strigosozonata HHB-11173 SS5]EIN09900.1 NAD(P)-binding protein [Punctularia strigosozonata HHB-11173 SS5]